MTTQTLLIELLTEELPPKALNNLGNHFAASVAEGLEKAQLIDGAANTLPTLLRAVWPSKSKT